MNNIIKNNTIRLDKNENPYPPSKMALKVIEKFDLSSLRLLPDENSQKLCEVFASSLTVDISNVSAVNGIHEAFSYIFQNVSNNKTNVILASPVKNLYKDISSFFKLNYEIFENEKDYTINLERLSGTDENSIFVLSNPNAETGMFTSIKDIEKFLNNFRGVCIIDESYASFSGESVVNLIKKYNNLIIIRSISYSHSLCGAKVYFIISDEKNIKNIDKVKDKYNIDTLTEHIAIAAIKDTDAMFENTLNIILERKRIEIELSKIGFITLPSRANFILIKPLLISANRLYEKLKENKILVKIYEKENVLESFIRLTVADEKTNNIVLNKIKTILKEITG